MLLAFWQTSRASSPIKTEKCVRAAIRGRPARVRRPRFAPTVCPETFSGIFFPRTPFVARCCHQPGGNKVNGLRSATCTCFSNLCTGVHACILLWRNPMFSPGMHCAQLPTCPLTLVCDCSYLAQTMQRKEDDNEHEEEEANDLLDDNHVYVHHLYVGSPCPAAF